MSDFTLDPVTHLGSVHLAVPNGERSHQFYVELLGFHPIKTAEDQYVLGAAEVPLIALLIEPHACLRPPRSTGLYHVGVRLPTRADLARVTRFLAEQNYPIQGAADHGVSESIYLDDPDGNAVELYADRPREVWPRHEGQLWVGTSQLDADSLLGELKGRDTTWNGMPDGTTIGHIHLQVSDLASAEHFYHDVLGFDAIQRYGDTAIYFSAGGYHQHVAVNTWAGVGAPAPPPGARGLRYFTICLPTSAEAKRLTEHLWKLQVSWEEPAGGLLLQDPSANRLLIEVEQAREVLPRQAVTPEEMLREDMQRPR